MYLIVHQAQKWAKNKDDSVQHRFDHRKENHAFSRPCTRFHNQIMPLKQPVYALRLPVRQPPMREVLKSFQERKSFLVERNFRYVDVPWKV